MMIFCVEDDRGIRELMTYTLNASGYDALGLKDGKELDEALKNEKPCLITLDIMLPNEDGISILKRLKNDERYHDIPIIMASAKGEEYDKVDNNFNIVKKQLIDIIHNDKNDGEYVIDILMCAKYFEKIGDHCVNIAKWTVFYLTGKHI